MPPRMGWPLCRYRHKGHLLRRCKDLQAAHPDSPWAGEVQAVLQDGLALRDRCRAGDISEHGLATARGRLVARLGRLLDTAPPLAAAQRFAKHLANEFPAVFLFLCDPSIDATNWRAEQAIRPAVVTRKVCGGNRTRKGADTQQVLASVMRTARQRRPDPRALFTTMLCARAPVVPRSACAAATRVTAGGPLPTGPGSAAHHTEPAATAPPATPGAADRRRRSASLPAACLVRGAASDENPWRLAALACQSDNLASGTPRCRRNFPEHRYIFGHILRAKTAPERGNRIP